MILEVDRYLCGETGLGPDGADFAAVWLHGCGRGCPGCIAANWNAGEAHHLLDAEFLARMLLHIQPGLRGVVLSGGEPFRQSAGAAELLSALDSLCGRRCGLMVYTGYRLDELRRMAEQNPAAGQLLARTDVLVDGPYEQALDDGKPYRGSSNQQMHFLSGRYCAADFQAERRSSTVTADSTEIALTGIPDDRARAALAALLACREG